MSERAKKQKAVSSMANGDSGNNETPQCLPDVSAPSDYSFQELKAEKRRKLKNAQPITAVTQLWSKFLNQTSLLPRVSIRLFLSLMEFHQLFRS